MSFQIERGLFRFDFTDHHAVLGIPVNADVKEVRKRYLNIARKLHPDSNKAESESEKKLASQLLSKLVNPAYEQLSQNNRDFVISLGHMGRRLAAEAGKVPVDSAAAKQLSQAGANLDITYKSLVQKLASGQYESLNQVLEKIAEISELNMVYLMVKAGRNEGINNGAPKTPVGTGAPRTPTATGTGAPRTPTGTGVGTSGGLGSNLADSQGASRVDAYIRRGEGYLAKNNFAAAVLELREALKLDQNTSRAHA
jgi:tetratricopeptide (TPR) repeat protein